MLLSFCLFPPFFLLFSLPSLNVFLLYVLLNHADNFNVKFIADLDLTQREQFSTVFVNNFIIITSSHMPPVFLLTILILFSSLPFSIPSSLSSEQHRAYHKTWIESTNIRWEKYQKKGMLYNYPFNNKNEATKDLREEIMQNIHKHMYTCISKASNACREKVCLRYEKFSSTNLPVPGSRRRRQRGSEARGRAERHVLPFRRLSEN